MFLIYGEDEYVLKKQVDKIVAKVQEQAELTYYEYSLLEQDWEKIKLEINTVDFFSSGKVFVLKDAYFLTDKTVKNGPNFKADDVKTIIEHHLPDVTIIFTVPYAKISKRTNIAKFVQEHVKVIPALVPNAQQIQAQIIRKLESNNIAYDDEAIPYLVAKLPTNLAVIQVELNKLSKIKGRLTTEVVDNVVTKFFDYDVFELSKTLIAGDLAQFIQIWKNFSVMNNDAYSVLALIAVNIVDLRNVVFYRTCRKSQNDVITDFSMKPYRVQVLWNNQARSFPQLNDIIQKMYTLIYNINSGFLNSKDFIEIELLKIFG
jgi:DNA polymerase-3 subunit delta